MMYAVNPGQFQAMVAGDLHSRMLSIARRRAGPLISIRRVVPCLVALGTFAAGVTPAIAYTKTSGPPAYTVYAPPAGMGASAGEPSIGVDERTGAVMYIASLETLKVQFNDALAPPTASWQNVSATQTSLVSFDPILYTDQTLGRTYVSQLLPTTFSLMAYTDDDGATWHPSQ